MDTTELMLLPLAETEKLSHIKLRECVPEELSLDGSIQLLKRNTEAWRELRSRYACALMEIETKFKVLNEEFSLQYDRNPIESIKTRIKSMESLGDKLMRKNLDFSLKTVEENIFDVAGIRVICSFPEDIYTLADCLIKQDDIRLVRKKDYIENPKPNGYRGLHLIVEVPIFLQNEKRPMKVEVQLRTIAMDFWASLEHKMRYKKHLDPQLAQMLGEELLECAEAASELDVKMQRIRNRIEERQ